MRPKRLDEIPIFTDLTLGVGGKASGSFTFTSEDNLPGLRVGDPYGDMEYHENYWLREEYA